MPRSSLAIEGFGVGDVCLPFPADPRRRAPVAIGNNLGEFEVLGEPTFRSLAAPWSRTRPGGFRRGFTLTLQGVIEDDDAPSGVLAVTNAVVVRPDAE